MAVDTFQLVINVLTLISLIFVILEFFSSIQIRRKEAQLRLMERYIDLFRENYESMEVSFQKMHADLLNIIFLIQERPFNGKKKTVYLKLMRNLFSSTFDNPGKEHFLKFLDTSTAKDLNLFSKNI